MHEHIFNRIKRALWAVSILIILGFGGHSVYEFQEDAKAENWLQDWMTKSRELSKECEKITNEVKAKVGGTTILEILNVRALALCDSRAKNIDEGISISFHAKFEAADAAQQSLKVAVVCPILLWILFFLFRWIWTSRLKKK
ncbi:MAG: hypothetical protein JWQ10_889 [Herbaspirillum sp.]|nr:hypothetical protein [Herbaspirillum sp.]